MDSRVKGRLQPSIIKNKIKRSEVTAKLRTDKKKDKKKRVKRRRQEEEKALELGEEPPPKKVPKTIENTREYDDTLVQADDDELQADEAEDEFSAHFNRQTTPKVLITTSYKASKLMYRFIRELLSTIPGAQFYERGPHHIKKIVKYATNRDFTALVVLNENAKRPNAALVMALPEGPTAYFKLSSLVLSKKIKGHGRPTSHLPELILNNFSTRLGHRLGRLFASLFPQDPQFKGRRVVTFHNQRDFIFFRHHRYVFEERNAKGVLVPAKKGKKKGAEAAEEQKEVITRLQECGPRFTLKLVSLQRGTFDSKGGEFEWIAKRDADLARRKFAV